MTLVVCIHGRAAGEDNPDAEPCLDCEELLQLRRIAELVRCTNHLAQPRAELPALDAIRKRMGLGPHAIVVSRGAFGGVRKAEVAASGGSGER